VVELTIVSGDINEFMIVADGETLETFYPEEVSFEVAALEERLMRSSTGRRCAARRWRARGRVRARRSAG